MDQKDVESFVQKLQQQRDELVLKMHLAKAEAKDEWVAAEKQWELFKAKTSELTKESGEGLKEVGTAFTLVGEELSRTYDRLKKVMEK